MRGKCLVTGLVAGLLAPLPGAALAHYPICTCAMADTATVRCVGGFSNGSEAPGVLIDVISYDERILVSGRTDAASSFQFQRPDGKFFVLFDAGPGHTVEIDYLDIQ
jgi:hypothetical protein